MRGGRALFRAITPRAGCATLLASVRELHFFACELVAVICVATACYVTNPAYQDADDGATGATGATSGDLGSSSGAASTTASETGEGSGDATGDSSTGDGTLATSSTGAQTTSSTTQGAATATSDEPTTDDPTAGTTIEPGPGVIELEAMYSGCVLLEKPQVAPYLGPIGCAVKAAGHNGGDGPALLLDTSLELEDGQQRAVHVLLTFMLPKGVEELAIASATLSLQVTAHPNADGAYGDLYRCPAFTADALEVGAPECPELVQVGGADVLPGALLTWSIDPQLLMSGPLYLRLYPTSGNASILWAHEAPVAEHRPRLLISYD